MFFLKILFIHETHRGRDRGRAPCREPDVGLDPRTPGSCPEPKAAAQLLSHPGVPQQLFFKLMNHLVKFKRVLMTCFPVLLYTRNQNVFRTWKDFSKLTKKRKKQFYGCYHLFQCISNHIKKKKVPSEIRISRTTYTVAHVLKFYTLSNTKGIIEIL